ncbi:MAG: bifunctional isocitrate dehydrogenase kinase/phosphatase [Ardenticatenaceae bacterium]|nr:bifunctional isocitrate dehydrogenase kinase/phosphatase [Ardenticatenaceae bacterium]HBY94992.1 bifunctional isocitrate dehydrogenase kinase/phosphatase [Chloroflexota bacterium]
MVRQTSDARRANRGAVAIRNAFDSYHLKFKKITRRARSRFEGQDWLGGQRDAVERLDLYKKIVDKIVVTIVNILGDQAKDRAVWAQMKERYSELIADRDDFELAETFFNSVTRRIFSTVGVDPKIEYVDSDFEQRPAETEKPVYKAYTCKGATSCVVREILLDYRLNVDYQDIELDIQLVANEIDSCVQAGYNSEQIDMVEVIKPIFYRNKGAYIIGRIYVGSQIIPLVIPLLNTERGIIVDAVLLTEDEASIVFSFTRSYFHVEVLRPYELICFLKSIMPLKRVAELYISIGYNKHGKTELYRDLLRHLAASDDTFVIARGARGMVMVVFTIPSYDVVFKIIKDQFTYPKTTTRQEVMDRYQLVFRRDRAGRLVDAQEFEHLEFDRSRFSDGLLEELMEVAASSVKVENGNVVIKHLYTERELTPLNLYLREANQEAACSAVTDYGRAIKDLAATNIFPGDFLLKNFGVTRHGRVVFYDYDELCLLTDCNFRRIPPGRDLYEDFEAEPWFSVGEHDIFPEEFERFLGLQAYLKQVFMEKHSDLLDVEFWQDMQVRHRAGEVIDVFPYRQSKRLSRSRS